MTSKIHICNCSRCGFQSKDVGQSDLFAACVELVKWFDSKALADLNCPAVRAVVDATREVTKETT